MLLLQLLHCLLVLTWPDVRTSSAMPGVLIRLVATRGTVTEPRSFSVTQAKPPLGTDVAIVGILASCQPIPVLIMVAPAASIALASSTTSVQFDPPSTKSSIERRNITIKSGRVAARTRSTIVVAKRVAVGEAAPLVRPLLSARR